MAVNMGMGESYPKELINVKLEFAYVGLLLVNPKSIAKYYLTFDESRFSDQNALDIYKSILFTEGGSFAPEDVKRKFPYPKASDEIYELKKKVKADAVENGYSLEKIYTKIKKLFLLKKHYVEAPTKALQQEILEIRSYSRYKEMTVEELEKRFNREYY